MLLFGFFFCMPGRSTSKVFVLPLPLVLKKTHAVLNHQFLPRGHKCRERVRSSNISMNEFGVHDTNCPAVRGLPLQPGKPSFSTFQRLLLGGKIFLSVAILHWSL